MGRVSRPRAIAGLGLVALLAGATLRGVSAQGLSFESALGSLTSKDVKARLRAVQLLTAAVYPEAAVPLAQTITDTDDEVQLEAIAAELNIFLAEKVTPRKRVGFIVEVRGRVAAEPLFTAGPSVLGALRVPVQVPMALVTASIDKNSRVAAEALYALGTLAGAVNGVDRPAVLAQAGSVLTGIVGAPDPVLRLAAVRVLGRLFASRRGDAPLDERVGDAVISALNDREDPVRETAMWALGAMKYERSVQALSELFVYYRKGPLAERAFEALARIGHQASAPQFVEQLNAKNPTLRRIAIEGLARTGDRSRAETILSLLKTERNESLLMSGHLANVLLADGSIDPLVDSLAHSRQRDLAFDYVSELAFGRTAALGRHAQSPNPLVRLALADVLGLSDDPAAIAVVEPLVADKDPGVALAARRAIARLRAMVAPES
jgi:HEAT repeat protein